MASNLHDVHDHDLGLAFDLSTLLNRRRALKLIAGIGLVAVGACGNDKKTPSSASATTTTAATSATSASATAATAATAASTDCETIPSETAGPFPGDGTNGPNALSNSGIVRSDITSSFGSSTTEARGIPLTVNLVILDQSNGCKPINGAAVYLWHCDREGRYSMYSQGVTDENYLRGVQEADANGRVTFKTVFPGCYSGRWPHIHFEVYPTVAKATTGSNKTAVSQLALPKDASSAVYATTGYESSVRNLSQISLTSDNVFRDDGGVHQLATMSGSVSAGYTAELTVPI